MIDSKLMRFPLGEILMTAGVIAMTDIKSAEISACLVRHVLGDWGVVGEEDWASNNRDIDAGGRLLSAYILHNGRKIWIITECDRSVTTILFPEEY